MEKKTGSIEKILLDLDYNSKDLCIDRYYKYCICDDVEYAKGQMNLEKECDFKPYFYVDTAEPQEIYDYLASIDQELDLKKLGQEFEDKTSLKVQDLITNIEVVEKIVYSDYIPNGNEYSNIKEFNNENGSINEKENGKEKETIKKFEKNKRKICKIYVKYPNHVKIIREYFKEFGKSYEFDIPFLRRYMIDNEIVPLTKYSEKAQTDDKIPELNCIAFDMEIYCKKEPNAKKDPIIMVNLFSKDYQKVITYKKFENSEYNGCIDYVKDEKELINRTIEILKQYDVIYTYNGDNFDFPYLKKRANIYEIELNFSNNSQRSEKTKKLDKVNDESNDESNNNLKLIQPQIIKISKGGINRKSKIPGIVHIDLYPIARKLLNLTKYKLENVVQELFKIEKEAVDYGDIPKMWETEDSTLLKYAYEDALYTYKMGNYFLPLEIMFSRIINQPLYDTSRMNSSQMVEFLLMKRSFEQNMISPNRPSSSSYRERAKFSYAGGYVREPLKGIQEDIVSLDFMSLYPSILISHNISPETVLYDEKERKNMELGIIPKTLDELLSRRKRIKKLLKDKIQKNEFDEEYNRLEHEQKSIKVLANSHYGYLAFPMARWYSDKCAEMVTGLGRKYIQETIEKAEKFGFKVIYADTDGFYAKWDYEKAKTKIEDSGDALELSKEELIISTKKFLKSINDELPEGMELEFEGYFKRGLFITKKKYALIEEDGHVVIKGLEVVRRDWSNIAKNTQQAVIKALLEDGDINLAKKIIKKTIDDLKKGNIDKNDLLIHTQLTKNIEEYKSTAPHIEVAKKIKQRGDSVRVGDVISYIIVKGSRSISERAELLDFAKDYDVNYYIDNQVLPPVIRIMESLGISEDELKNSGKQFKLDHFM
ncbi:DNA-directed DNA polymerase [Methanococcus voltae]|uniref:DNA polymerase n=1 Tax=Methanococcus voltae (strain ATCC BAA-1334 / A3) TaxID=456320 RepID=D7DR48_METV3|nr:DNA polymerase domain-containing protein [Methanococcus voltae]MCS3900985.1 DNA polymerase I [Methanococcus voltae]